MFRNYRNIVMKIDETLVMDAAKHVLGLDK